MKREEKWTLYFNLVAVFKEKNGNLSIPTHFKTFNGYTYDKNGYDIYHWLHWQTKENTTNEQQKLLKSIGHEFKTKRAYKKLSWDEYYKLAKAYYEQYNNLEIAGNFITFDGINYDKDGYHLGDWLSRQRIAKKKNTLSKERIQLLDKLEMRWDNLNEFLSWNEMYKLAKAYYEKFKDLEVPRHFKTFDGITENEAGYDLGAWVATQRHFYQKNKLSSERKALLDKLEMRWESKFKKDKKKTAKKKNVNGRQKHLDKQWNEAYKLAKKYYQKHNHLNVTYLFKTKDGYSYDEDGFCLGRWLKKQRLLYRDGLLSEGRIKLLEKINMDFNIIDFEENWQEKFELAKKYYEAHKHLNVPLKFKTKNGLDYDEEGINLGNWIRTQRSWFKKGILAPERFILLSSIGMIWNISKSDGFVEYLCQTNNIDYEKNKLVLEHINHYEFNAKINYLLTNNVPLVCNGTLHEIFSTSSVNMQIIYGINLETMITMYYEKGLILDRYKK